MSRLAWLLALGLAGCAADPPSPSQGPCEDRNPLRNAYFGDLHVHTSYSFDAGAYGNPLEPADAYRFAAGEPVSLAPAEGPRTARIDRPLDFVAVTDHGEFLGEVAT